MLILCEIKKIWKSPWFCVFILVGLVLNFALAVNQCRGITGDDLYAAKAQMYQDHGGILTREKVNWIRERYKELSGQVAAGDYDTTRNDEYYSGYLFGDCNILESMYTRLVEISEYQNHRDSTCKKLKQTAQLYQNVGNQGKKFLMNQIAEKYEERNITVLQDDSFFQALLDYRGSSFLLIFLALYLFTVMVNTDRELGTDSLLKTTISGKKWVPVIQPAAGLLIFVFLSSMFYLEDYLVFGLIYQGIHLTQPLYYIQGFGETFFSGNIGLFFLLTGLMRGMGIAAFGLFCSFIANCGRNRMFSFGLCLFVLLFFLLHIDWVDSQQICWWNPLGSLICMMWYKIPLFVTIRNDSISYPWFAFGVHLLQLTSGYTATVCSSGKKRCMN